MKYRSRMRLASVAPEGKEHIVFPGNEAWTNLPILNWNRHNRKVNLNANWDDDRNWNYAVPVVRDCPSK